MWRTHKVWEPTEALHVVFIFCAIEWTLKWWFIPSFSLGIYQRISSYRISCMQRRFALLLQSISDTLCQWIKHTTIAMLSECLSVPTLGILSNHKITKHLNCIITLNFMNSLLFNFYSSWCLFLAIFAWYSSLMVSSLMVYLDLCINYVYCTILSRF